MENHCLKGHFWFRESTQEWLFQVEMNMFDADFTGMFPGKTKIDAIKEFRENFNEIIDEFYLKHLTGELNP